MKPKLFWGNVGWGLWLLAAGPLQAGPLEGSAPGNRLPLLVLALLLLLAAQLGFAALLQLYNLARPAKVRAGAQILARHPMRCLLAGGLSAAILLLLMVLAANLGQGGNLGPAGKLVTGVVCLGALAAGAYWLVAGAGMLCLAIGDKLLANLNSRHLGSSAAAVGAGSVLLLGVAYLPVLGLLLLLPAFLAGAGAAVSLLLARRPPPAPAGPDAPT